MEDPESQYERARIVCSSRRGTEAYTSLVQRRVGRCIAHDRLLGFCRKVAFLRPNVKIVCCKISDLRASTFLFSVICDRTLPFPCAERLCPDLTPCFFRQYFPFVSGFFSDYVNE